ncbi:MAG: hypothetical protein OER77_17570 [Myxococcales bacterium]|nr:hypothetical protein [Myxococcales bacterium]
MHRDPTDVANIEIYTNAEKNEIPIRRDPTDVAKNAEVAPGIPCDFTRWRPPASGRPFGRRSRDPEIRPTWRTSRSDNEIRDPTDVAKRDPEIRPRSDRRGEERGGGSGHSL